MVFETKYTDNWYTDNWYGQLVRTDHRLFDEYTDI
jgi:hypothetical protein